MLRFLMYAHTDPMHLARLCERLRPYPVYVHIDKKVDSRPFIEKIPSQDRQRVRFLNGRVCVNWAGYSQVQAMRLLVRRAHADSHPADYFVMLSGQDYPLKRPADLEAFLTANQGKQFIKSFEVDKSSPSYEKHIKTRHHRDLALLRSTKRPIRKFRNGLVRVADFIDFRRLPHRPDDLIVCHGQTHWALTADCAKRLDDSITQEVEHFFRSTFAPDEKVFHSLACSLRSRDGTPYNYPDPFMGGGNWRYTNLHHVDESLTKVFVESDWPGVVDLDSFFIRKVESGRSASLLDVIDTHLLHERELSDPVDPTADRSEAKSHGA